MLRAQWSALVGRPPPLEMVDADERRFFQSCLPFTQALHRHAGRLDAEGQLGSAEPGAPDSLLLAVEAVRQRPPKMAAADLEWCASYTGKGLRAQLGAMRAEEAQSTLQAMGGAMAAAFGRDGKLCPPTVEPVPPKLEQLSSGTYQPKAEDWDAPSWRCLRFRWLRPLRFQYELRSSKDAFTLVARGSLTDDGTVDEVQLAGAVRDGAIELGRVTGRFLGAPADAGPATSASPAPPSSAPPSAAGSAAPGR